MIDNDRMWASLIKSIYGMPIHYWLKNRIDDALKEQGLRYNPETKEIESIEQELTEFEKTVKGLLFDAGDKYNLNDDLDKATKDLAPHFLEAARKQFIEEACEWLYDVWPQIAESPQFIEDFRKALEKGGKE